MMFESESLVVDKKIEQSMNIAEIIMLRWMSD